MLRGPRLGSEGQGCALRAKAVLRGPRLRYEGQDCSTMAKTVLRGPGRVRGPRLCYEGQDLYEGQDYASGPRLLQYIYKLYRTINVIILIKKYILH